MEVNAPDGIVRLLPFESVMVPPLEVIVCVLAARVPVTVSVAEADLVVSATLVAAIVTLLGLGTTAGAVYNPLFEIVAVRRVSPATPSTVHLTAVFDEPVIVALNCCVFPVTIVPEVGEMETVIGFSIVIVAEADLVAGRPRWSLLRSRDSCWEQKLAQCKARSSRSCHTSSCPGHSIHGPLDRGVGSSP